MIFAKNRQTISPQYSPEQSWRLERGQYANKLTIRVRGNPVILGVTEMEEQFFDATVDNEQLLEVGFHSRTFITPVTGWRFRSEAGTANVDFVAYA